MAHHIEFPSKPDCTFCRLLADPAFTDSDDVLCGNDSAVAFLDSFPLNPGHALIVPRLHTPDLFELTPEEHTDLFALLPQVRSELEARGFPADGYNVGINIGLAAGQTIGHLHMHLIPRVEGDCDYKNDGFTDPRGGVRWVVPAKADYWN